MGSWSQAYMSPGHATAAGAQIGRGRVGPRCGRVLNLELVYSAKKLEIGRSVTALLRFQAWLRRHGAARAVLGSLVAPADLCYQHFEPAGLADRVGQ
jgi:hypothetical protein